MKFAIAIEPGNDRQAYGVVIPDLPGCFSAGDSLEDAFDHAREAIEVHCETLAQRGEDLPRPKPLSAWQADPEFHGWTWGIIDVSVEKLFGPAEKITITVPALTLRRIDAWVQQHGETRSGFLVKAAERAMN